MSISTALLEIIANMSIPELSELNHAVHNKLVWKRLVVSNKAKHEFAIGDICEFFSKKTRETVRFKIERKGPKNLIGSVINSDGTTGHTRWTVSPTFVTKVEPIKPAAVPFTPTHIPTPVEGVMMF